MGATILQANEATTTRSDAAIYGIAVLTGAALVFQIQPIAGKLLLPVFGGGAAVWTTCMFFFQSMLLAGYGYAHWLTRTLAPGGQATLHGVLLLVSAILLPFGFSVDFIDDSAAVDGPPSMLIWVALLSTIGFPFVMLSATAPLMQRWASITRPTRSPYGLYALSNAGALLALLTYPVLVEPNLSLDAQSLAWSGGYLLFLLASLTGCRLLWRCRGSAATGPVAAHGSSATPWTVTDAVLAALLSACGVVMLLAVTNQITANVAPIPFLWIAPLVVYLLSFVICYGSARWYDRPIWGALFVVAACLLVMLEFFGASASIRLMLSAYLLVLLCTCMVCHGELYKLRPSPENLARYYLLIALGGALGGGFVSVVAPALFDRYREALIGVYLIYLLFGAGIFRDARSERRAGVRKPPRQALLDRWTQRLFAVGWTIGVVAWPAVVLLVASYLPRYDIVSSRNFYGVLKVRDVTDEGPPQRRLVDGTTIHGVQSLDPARRSEPLSYYGHRSGIGYVMERLRHAEAGLEIGVVGLGIGTLAAYGRPDDAMRFYELNPAVVDLAREHFSFLGDSQAAFDVVIGDGRISLERELQEDGGRGYDLLVIDAFTSDAIPVHLLTKEALAVYWSHLRPGGVLAVHVTNSYLDLVPVVGDAAAALGRHAVNLQSVASDDGTFNADWVVVTERPDFVGQATAEWLTAMRLPTQPVGRVWTDDYSDLLGAVRD